MAYDIPSISDLEAIQLLNKHYAEVITSKEGGVSSAADITQTTNPITGVTRRTLYKILDDAQIEHDAQITAHEVEHDNQMQSFENDFDSRLAGMAFTPVGTFTEGATLTDARQILLWEVSEGGDGHYYSWSGTFPKVVSAGSSPSPIEAGSWVDRTDDSLRDEIRATVFQTTKHQAAEAGFNLVDGSFEEGANISGWPDVVWCQTDGKYYQWHLNEAKTVAAGSTPETTGGIGLGAWVDAAHSNVEERLLGAGAKIYRGSNGAYVQNGDVVPVGTTHLAVLINGKVETVTMSPVASGAVSLLTETGATVGGSLVNFGSPFNYVITFKNDSFGSAVENMIAGRVNGIAGAVIHRAGNIYSTGGTTWECLVGGASTLVEFSPRGDVLASSFGIIPDYLNWDGSLNPNKTDQAPKIVDAILQLKPLNCTLAFDFGWYYYNKDSVGEVVLDFNDDTSIKIKGGAKTFIVFDGTSRGNQFNIAAPSSQRALIIEDISLMYIGSSTNSQFATVSRTGVDNTWGGYIRMKNVTIRDFTQTQLVLIACYNCVFDECFFYGADGQTYSHGQKQPAVVGANSDCITIYGGIPTWPGLQTFSNLLQFNNCEFQRAKYGVRGFFLREVDFSGCTFQYLWVGISNVLDEDFGSYGRGNVSLSGQNYFEFINNRCLAGFAVNNTTGEYELTTTEAKFYGDTFFFVKYDIETQGSAQVSKPDAIEIDRTDFGANGVDNDKPILTASVATIKVANISKDGVAFFRKGYDFSNMLPRVGTDQSEKVLDKYYYDTLPTLNLVGTTGSPSGGVNSTKETVTGRVGNVFVSLANNTSNGSGNVVIKTTNSFVSEVLRISVVSAQGCATAPTVLYGRAAGGASAKDILLYTNPQLTIPLVWGSGLDLVGGTFKMSAEYLTSTPF